MRQKNNYTRSIWMIWVVRLINLYPASWRERYADEMLAILEEHPPTFWTLGDILLNLCDAHLHSDIVAGGTFVMLKRFNSGITMIFSVGLMFCLISLPQQLYLTMMTDDLRSSYLHSQSIYLPNFTQLMVLVLNYICYALAILVVLYGVSLLVLASGQVFKTRHVGSFFLYLFGFLCPLIAVASYFYGNILYIRYGYQVGVFYDKAHPMGHASHLLLILFPILHTLVFFLIGGGGIWALRVALRWATPGFRMPNLTLVLATLIGFMMLVYNIGLLSLVVCSFSSGFWQYIWNASFWLLPASTLVVLYALVRAHQARRTLTVQAQIPYL